MQDDSWIVVVVCVAGLLFVPYFILLAVQQVADWATSEVPVKAVPAGGFPVQVAPLRYAVLHHTNVAAPHFDLLFERQPGGSLMTWRSVVWPVVDFTPLERLADHRREYLEYEGPVSGDRGEVRRVAGGGFGFEMALEDCFRIRIEGGALFSIRQRADGAGWFVEVHRLVDQTADKTGGV